MKSKYNILFLLFLPLFGFSSKVHSDLLSSNSNNSTFTIDLDTPKGIYFLRLKSQGEIITKKIVIE